MLEIPTNVWKTQTAQATPRPKGAFIKSLLLVSSFKDGFIHYVLNIYEILVIVSYHYLPSYLINNKLDPCEKIICNGTNAQCQVYLGGKNEGKAFCACPQGFTGDPDFNCGKYVQISDSLQQ